MRFIEKPKKDKKGEREKNSSNLVFQLEAW